VLNLFREGKFSSLLFYGPMDCGKISFLNGLCNQFFRKMEQSQILHITSFGKFIGNGLNKKIDDFQSNHFYSKKLTKIIIFENFESLGNMIQLSMRERMQKKNIKTKFWLISKFFSKINHSILSRCVKLYFNLIFPTVSIVRFIEILNKENMCTSIEILQYLINLNKDRIVYLLQTSFYNPYFIGNVSKKSIYFYHQEFTSSVYTDIFTKEGKLIVIRKLKFYEFHDSSLIHETFKKNRKQLFSIIPLIVF